MPEAQKEAGVMVKVVSAMETNDYDVIYYLEKMLEVKPKKLNSTFEA